MTIRGIKAHRTALTHSWLSVVVTPSSIVGNGERGEKRTGYSGHEFELQTWFCRHCGGEFWDVHFIQKSNTLYGGHENSPLSSSAVGASLTGSPRCYPFGSSLHLCLRRALSANDRAQQGYWCRTIPRRHGLPKQGILSQGHSIGLAEAFLELHGHLRLFLPKSPSLPYLSQVWDLHQGLNSPYLLSHHLLYHPQLFPPEISWTSNPILMSVSWRRGTDTPVFLKHLVVEAGIIQDVKILLIYSLSLEKCIVITSRWAKF